MAVRQKGSNVVVMAVTATITALLVGTVYVPYFADRDKLRGMHEDADGGMSAFERREYEKYMRDIQAQGGGSLPNSTPVPDRSMPKGNSMWTRLNQTDPEKK